MEEKKKRRSSNVRPQKKKKKTHSLLLPLSLSTSSPLRRRLHTQARLRFPENSTHTKKQEKMKSSLSFLLAALLALLLLASPRAALAQDCAAAIAAVPSGCGSKRFCEHTACGGGAEVSQYAKCCCCQGSG